MNNIVQFQNKQLTTINHNGQIWLSAKELSKGLGYSDDRTVQRIYTRNSDEFTDDMTGVVKLTTPGGIQEKRCFSPRGCHLIAMFARTPFAKEFRKWVLDVLEKNNTPATVPMVQNFTHDRDTLKTIGGIVKKCTRAAIREELTQIDEPALERMVALLINTIVNGRVEVAYQNKLAEIKRLLA